MPDKEVQQIISAYVTGCLDKNNFIQFVNYFRGGGELPKGEMGELQNVIALIPTILELEDPPPDLKNQVAKKILEIEETNKVREKTIAEENRQRMLEREAALTAAAENAAKAVAVISEKEQPPEFGTKAWFMTYLPWISAGAATLLLIGVTIYFLISNSGLQTEIDQVNNQMLELEKNYTASNNFVINHRELVEFLDYKNIEVVTFQGAEDQPDAYGKFFVSFEIGEGILQLKNLPKLSSREAYQLWMVSETQSYSLGTIFINSDREFYKIENIPSLPRKDISMFRITKESRTGSDRPIGPLYLFGAFYNDSEQTSF